MRYLVEELAGKRLVLSGAEAVARGALEAGISVATSYPGLQSDVLDLLTRTARNPERLYDFYAEWSVNEKVALEVAIGFALAGGRGLASMEHVGLNVASDSLVSVALSGIDGALVVLTADDVGGIGNATGEQDNRYYAQLAHIPILEPSTPQSTKDGLVDAFVLSEEFGLPVLVRVTSEVLFMRAPVVLGSVRCHHRSHRFVKDFSRYFLLGESIPRLHRESHAKLEMIAEKEDGLAYNSLEGEGAKKGIIVSGASYTSVKEALTILGASAEDCSILRIGMPYPLSRTLITRFVEEVDTVLVVEEVEPVVEEQLKSMAYGLAQCRIFGRSEGLLPDSGNLDACDVARAIERAFGWEATETNAVLVKEPDDDLSPERTLTFCAGCPHMGATYALKMVLKKKHLLDHFIVVGDIGCYSLAGFPPHQIIDTNLNMASSIATACGLVRAQVKDFVIANIGDSSFFHSAVPALMNAVYTDVPLFVFLNDNRCSALTGGHITPEMGSPKDDRGEHVIKMSRLIAACGVRRITVIDPYDLDESMHAISEAIDGVLENGELVAVIAQRTCATLKLRDLAREGVETQDVFVDRDDCTGCRLCITQLGCPALFWKGGGAEIDPTLCVGCGLCAQVCPEGAIKSAVPRSLDSKWDAGDER